LLYLQSQGICGGNDGLAKFCCFDDVIMEVWNFHRCSWVTLYTWYSPDSPWKQVHGFHSKRFSDFVHIQSVASNAYEFICWPEFRPPASMHPRL